ncbi:MAG: alcohol dehydrogenase catalytic domain-containing protein [Anaerolineae bacterium]|jgi:2-desacetyl-2-hydroxyethyl bacteriochlorophyllide A dehydrogenase|nr:alcohol dehydrogenase catalytic domain-containing protein [Anaerolineae bacterium]MBT7069484.1 alcohol dehydrogenase catalytic domain-containing protein [Anaerolineae bacterium]MBT7325113.1 alcohol dehydrogenase catalytic domain-containing protein [Anaerolineae bacterium]
MKSLWLENQKLTYKENQSNPVNADEALIRVRLAGICGTDLEMVRGYYPFTGVPGHEFVGEVVECADKSWIGKRVVGEINVTCGNCEQCQNGRSTHCEDRTTLGIHDRDGIFAEYVTLPTRNLVPVPDLVSDEKAVFTELVAAALEITQEVHIRPTDRVLVIGAGRFGQLIAQVLQLTGADLNVVARHPRQRWLLTERGINLIDETDVQPWRWDVVVDVTGSASGFSLARQAIRPRGTLVMKSTYKGDMQVNFSSLVVDEINIVGSRCGPFAPALRLLESGLVDPLGMIAAEYPLEDGLKAFEHASQRGVLKVLLRP